MTFCVYLILNVYSSYNNIIVGRISYLIEIQSFSKDSFVYQQFVTDISMGVVENVNIFADELVIAV